MSEQTRQLVERLRQRLQATIRRHVLADVLTGALLTVGALALLWLLGASLEAGLWMGTGPRQAFAWTVGLVLAGVGGFFLIRPALRLIGWLPAPGEVETAAEIGKQYPAIADRFVNLLQLAGGNASDAPSPLLDGAVTELSRTVEPVPFEETEDFSRPRRLSRWVLAPVLGLLAFLVAAPGAFTGATARLLAPRTAFNPPAPFTLTVLPGDTDLVKGETLDIAVSATGEQPQAIFVTVGRAGEERTETARVEADSAGVYRYRVVNVRHDVRYAIDADPLTLGPYTARIVERPIVRGLQVQLDFPAYTRIPPRRLAPGIGDVAALPGTRVSVTAGLGGSDVAQGRIRFDDTTSVDLTIAGTAAEGTFTVTRAGQYQVELESPAGIRNADPISYQIALERDERPSVTLLDPKPQTELDDLMAVRLRARILDDFGFSNLQLYYRLAESAYGEPQEDYSAIPLSIQDARLLDQEIVFDWLLTSTGLDLVPKDVIEYYIEVRDNDAVAGYKRGRTPVFRLNMPSLAERYDELDTQQDEAEEELEDMVRDAETIRDEFEELRDELRRKQEADWEDRRQLERLTEQQRQLESRADQLSDQMQEMLDQMSDNDLVQQETMQMYEQLQEVMDQVNDPELQEALQKLQEAMQNMDMSEMQQSMGEFEFNEEQYRQRLERALELFKRLRTQQRLDEASRRAEELAEKQEQLAEETEELKGEGEQDEGGRMKDEGDEGEREQGEGEQGEREQGEGEQGEQGAGEQSPEEQGEGEQGEQNSDEQQQSEQNASGEQLSDQQPPNQDPANQDPAGQNPPNQQPTDQLAEDQLESKAEMERLEELIDEVQQEMDELQQAPSEQMQQLQDQVQQQNLPQQMQQNAEQLQQQQLNQAQQGQQQMQQQLQQMQQRMQQMQAQMNQQQAAINIAALRRVLDDVLTLSKSQEDLRMRTQEISASSPSARRYSQQQVELQDGLRSVADTLQTLSRQIPQMSRLVQQRSGDGLRDMERAVSEMSERRLARATGHQKSAMSNLNELALLLSDLMDQMQNQQNQQGGGMSMQQMLQQMQQMSGQQQMLNQQLQQMLNDAQGNRLSQDQQQRLEQMGRQQDAIRQQLQQLMQEGGSQTQEKMLGDLNQIARQMEEAIQELSRGNLNQETVRRQQQILTRLLDAQRSMRERGRERRREGQQGTDQQRTSPNELPASEAADQLRRDLIRALDSGYAPDYEELIKRYFDLLQRQQEG